MLYIICNIYLRAYIYPIYYLGNIIWYSFELGIHRINTFVFLVTKRLLQTERIIREQCLKKISNILKLKMKSLSLELLVHLQILLFCSKKQQSLTSTFKEVLTNVLN